MQDYMNKEQLKLSDISSRLINWVEELHLNPEQKLEFINIMDDLGELISVEALLKRNQDQAP